MRAGAKARSYVVGVRSDAVEILMSVPSPLLDLTLTFQDTSHSSFHRFSLLAFHKLLGW